MECKKWLVAIELVEIASQVCKMEDRTISSWREGGRIVFQSRSTSNVSTRLLEASPINEAFLANLAPSVLLPSPPFPHPSSLINNARINFAIRSPYRKRDPPCFTDKVTRRYPDGDTSTEFWIGQLAPPCLRLCLLDSS